MAERDRAIMTKFSRQSAIAVQRGTGRRDGVSRSMRPCAILQFGQKMPQTPIFAAFLRGRRDVSFYAAIAK
jgi:hypothetical protein